MSNHLYEVYSTLEIRIDKSRRCILMCTRNMLNRQLSNVHFK